VKLTAVFEPAQEGGYTCFVEEIPAAISQGETLEEAKANLRNVLQLVVECQRELAEKISRRRLFEKSSTWPN
jgi:predicted RNase H-like HicB family nuclease